MNNFGNFLYQLRKEKGMTQFDLAEILGVTNKAVSKWESGTAFPETAQLVPIANIFNVTVDELLKGKRESDNSRQQAVCEEQANKTNTENKCCGECFSCEDKCVSKKEMVCKIIALAIILLGVFSMIIMLICNVNKTIYISIMFLCIAIGVFLFIINDIEKLKRKYELNEEQIKKQKILNIAMGLGVAILILSPVSIFLTNEFGMEDKFVLLTFFAVLLVGIMVVIIAGMIGGNEKKLYKCKDMEVVQAEIRQDKLSGMVGGILMPLATIVFLILGYFGYWHPGWVVFPIAAILTGLITSIIMAIKRNR